MTRTSIALWMLVTAIAAAPLWAGRAAGRDHDRRTLASPGKSQSRRFGATTDHANPDQFPYRKRPALGLFRGAAIVDGAPKGRSDRSCETSRPSVSDDHDSRSRRISSGAGAW